MKRKFWTFLFTFLAIVTLTMLVGSCTSIAADPVAQQICSITEGDEVDLGRASGFVKTLMETYPNSTTLFVFEEGGSSLFSEGEGFPTSYQEITEVGRLETVSFTAETDSERIVFFAHSGFFDHAGFVVYKSESIHLVWESGQGLQLFNWDSNGYDAVNCIK